MSAKDIAAKEFFNRPFIIADLCNCIIFNGEKRIMPENVRFLSTELTAGPQDTNNESLPTDTTRIRDSLCLITFMNEGKEESFELGLEFQSNGNINILFRDHDYDGRGYTRMVNARKRKQKCIICPIITLTINLTCRPWNYPCSLKVRFKKSDKAIRKYLNFRMNLLDPFTLDENIINSMCTELKTVINCFRYSRDREMLFKILTNIPGDSLSREAVHLLNTFLNLGLKIPEKEEMVSMCKAAEELKQMWLEEGIQQGIKQGVQQGVQQEREQCVIRMLRKNTSPAQIHELIGIPIKRILAIASKNFIKV